MTVTLGEHNGWSLLRVAGELDMVSAPGVRRAVHELVAEGRRSLVLDLSEVEFCDSTGIGMLVAARRLMRSCAGRMRLVLPARESHVNRVLAAMGVRRLFDIHPDPDTATLERPQDDLGERPVRRSA
ncbi:STAS domain-containing protein [Allostreptomyces psammosilenae]|uniref:Anti-sigma factor antagonist n=1 Tax=Allostreptomyces psammosilenae TaxID=1892865 RepID=A0A853A2Q4_9ACTN|nr:STAS domain-containing protein [Allostreptomyces psammosilenae]NYI07750.1 anti-anti-sigma factor [Allostreptomyces psammosilenae]